jgi:ubiquinone/menaquinone biosynthesis C-methylase UbiE
MGIYDKYVLPHLVSIACSPKPIRKQRERIVPFAEGDVLEIGFGSGLNLSHYDRHKVRKVLALEPSEAMRRKALPGVRASGLEVEFIDLPGEEIPLETSSVDTVLVTYSLCTIADAETALEGMRRVLRPGGRLLYCEHGRAPDSKIRRWQERIDPLWSALAGGCHINKDIPALLRAGGFDLEKCEQMYIPGPKIVSYNYWGIAVASR